MSPNRTAIASAIGLTLVLGASASQAAYWTFSVRADFNAKLAELGLAPVVHDFDGLAAGPISVGTNTSYDRITFDTASILGGGDLSVVGGNDPPTISPYNQIGTNNYSNYYQMVNGSEFTFSIPPSKALGLYVQSAGIIQYDTDFTLFFGDGSASVDPAKRTAVNPGNTTVTYAYFLGIIDNVGMHSSGTLSSPAYDDTYYYFTADDFVTAAPVPATLALIGLGLIAMRVSKSRRAA